MNEGRDAWNDGKGRDGTGRDEREGRTEFIQYTATVQM
jgi:hypothetical protein